MKTMKTVVCACAVAAGFAGGVAVGHWAWPGGDRAAEVEEGVSSEADESSEKEDGVVAQVGGEEDCAAEFVEAVPAESVQDDAGEGEVTVEEVRDEDGLTDEELRERFKQEHPEEWERQQQRRRELMAKVRQAFERKQGFLDLINEDYLTDEQRRTHAAYVQALAERVAVRERMRKAAEAGEPPKVEDYRILRQSVRILREYAEVERRTLREAAGRSLGLTGEDVGAFAEMLESIDDAVNESPSPRPTWSAPGGWPQ